MRPGGEEWWFSNLVNERLLFSASSNVDPITAIFSRDWAALGGWSLFIGLVMLIVLGAFREWWVPGPRYHRLETSATKQSEMLAISVETNKTLSTANEITKHFFESTVPKRGEPKDDS